MPDFAPNFTGRYKVRYLSNTLTHTMILRYNASVTNINTGDAAALSSAMAEIAIYLPKDFSFLEGQYCPAGETIFQPSFTPATSANHALNGYDHTLPAFDDAKSGMISLYGKSANGGSTLITVLGVDVGAIRLGPGVASWRISTGADAELQGFRDALQAMALHTSGNQLASFVQYFNLKYNDYWVNQLR